MTELTSKSVWHKLRLAEWAMACLVTVVLVKLHWVLLQHAGALWRDETGIINITMLPSLGQVFETLPHDHCPILFPVLVKTWSALGFGSTDGGLRVFGFGVGLLLLATFWAATRIMGKGLPLLSLALIAMNFTVILFGDSLRAYGLATICILLTMSLVWRFLEMPNIHRGLLAGAAAVLSVQALYQNAFLVLAICLAGGVVCIRRRHYRAGVAVLSMGLAAAFSLLPYIKPMHEAQDWWIVSKSGFSIVTSLSRIVEAVGGNIHLWFVYVWFMVVMVAVVLAFGDVYKPGQQDKTRHQQDLILFAGVVLVAGMAGFGLFIKLTELLTQIWYYVPLLGLAVVCCDIILAQAHVGTRIGVFVIAIVSVWLAYPSAHFVVNERRTNGDLLAAQLSKSADAGDMIIVHPWYVGITFARYYKGNTPWTTLPPLEDYRYHRYDLIKLQMQMTNAIEPVLKQAETTLRSGHRIWIVGEIPLSQSDEHPPKDLPPAPNGPQGWFDAPYTENWCAKLGYFLGHHITDAQLLVDPSTNSVSSFENIKLSVLRGWDGLGQTNAPEIR